MHLIDVAAGAAVAAGFGRLPPFDLPGPARRSEAPAKLDGHQAKKQAFVPSVGEPCLSQALRKPGQILRSTEREHVGQIRDTQRGIKFTQARHRFMRLIQVTSERIAGCQNAVGSWIVRLLA